MALPTITECKAYARKEDSSEDTLFTSLLARAIATIETMLGYALTAAAITHTDYDERDNWGVQPMLQLPGPFKTSGPAPVVTDKDGVTVAATEYDLDPRGLKIRAKPGVTFTNRPYSIAATVGLSVHPDYTARLEAVVSQAIVELVAHWYMNRNPAATGETDEGGAARVVTEDGIPDRIVSLMTPLPIPRGMLLA